MKAVPKPTKKDRIAVKTYKKQQLSDYRQAQAALAIARDGDRCVFCHFLLGKDVLRSDVHHIYGRGKVAGDWREQYTSLVCTCRRHHPQPIKGLPGSSSPEMTYIEEILRLANENPINEFF